MKFLSLVVLAMTLVVTSARAVSDDSGFLKATEIPEPLQREILAMIKSRCTSLVPGTLVVDQVMKSEHDFPDETGLYFNIWFVGDTTFYPYPTPGIGVNKVNVSIYNAVVFTNKKSGKLTYSVGDPYSYDFGTCVSNSKELGGGPP